jgi:hypothetical protein
MTAHRHCERRSHGSYCSAKDSGKRHCAAPRKAALSKQHRGQQHILAHATSYIGWCKSQSLFRRDLHSKHEGTFGEPSGFKSPWMTLNVPAGSLKCSESFRKRGEIPELSLRTLSGSAAPVRTARNAGHRRQTLAPVAEKASAWPQRQNTAGAKGEEQSSLV